MTYRALQDGRSAVGLNALTVVVCLDVIAWLSGFTIGWLLSLANAALGLLLAGLATHYRPQILLATLVSLLLALFMRGHFVPSRLILEILLGLASAGAAIKIVRTLQRREARPVSTSSLAMVACLGGLALLVDSPMTSVLAFLTIALCALLAAFFREQRWRFLLVSWVSVVWVINLWLET